MPSDPIQPDARSITLSVRRLGLAQAGDADLPRTVPIEAPIAIEVGGFGYAVMMATPADLEDYAIGFALAEGLITRADQMDAVDAVPLDNGGWVLRLWLSADRAGLALERARTRLGESSCGLCGMDSIEAVLAPCRAWPRPSPRTAPPSPKLWRRSPIISRWGMRQALSTPLPSAAPMVRSCSPARMSGGTMLWTSWWARC